MLPLPPPNAILLAKWEKRETQKIQLSLQSSLLMLPSKKLHVKHQWSPEDKRGDLVNASCCLRPSKINMAPNLLSYKSNLISGCNCSVHHLPPLSPDPLTTSGGFSLLFGFSFFCTICRYPAHGLGVGRDTVLAKYIRVQTSYWEHMGFIFFMCTVLVSFCICGAY